MKVTFENISYEVMPSSSSKSLFNKKCGQLYHVVKNVSGYALPGETLFIMGASGAGKTSLLNILSDRASTNNGAKITGKVLINDRLELKGTNFGKIAGYVMQDDVLFQYFTPREALTFAARLKLSHMSTQE